MEPIKDYDPKQLGDWRIMGRLGEGGFGTVFLAERGAQKAAIKIVRDVPESLIEGHERFRLEITALEKLVDPYIAKVIDSDLSGQVPWFATEFINGPTLEAKVKYEGVLEERNWFNLAANLFHALKTSHAAGVVHKDIKPSNIILGETGNKLIDFGIAHVSGHTRKVNFGDFEGSRPYSSPESSTGNSVPGMDVFSAAVTLAFAGLGRSIWEGENEVQLMRSINESEPDLDGLTEFQATFLRPLLNKNVSDRPSSEDAYKTCLKILNKLDGNNDLLNLKKWKRSTKKAGDESRRLKVLSGFAVLTLVAVAIAANLNDSVTTKNPKVTSQPSSTPKETTPEESSSPTFSSDSATDNSPTSKEIQANLDLAKKYYEQGDLSKSLNYAKLAAAAGNAHGMYDVGLILADQGKNTEAVVWYEKAAKLNYGDAFWNLGALYMKMGKESLAVKSYENGVAQNNVGSINALGFYYGDTKKDLKKSLTYYLKSADLGSVMGMSNVGFTYDEMNDKVNATKWYRKASDLGSIDASLNLGYLYEKNSDWTNARKYYERAADKKDPTAMYDLAIVLGNHFGQGDKGCVLLKEAITIDSIEPEILKLANDAIAQGCKSTPTISPSPGPSTQTKLTDGDLSPLLSYKSSEYSEKISTEAKTSGIFGRAYLSQGGLDWIIPLTNSGGESVPPINRVQFRDSSLPYGSWWNMPYELRDSGSSGWQAVVSNLGIQLLHSTGKKVCPAFRFALVQDGLVTYTWSKSVEPCTVP
jgi:serine/threonine protein kinase